MPYLLRALSDHASAFLDVQDTEEVFAALNQDPRRTGCLVLVRPTDAELEECSRRLGLHKLAVEDTRKGHQRPKIERYEETLFAVLHRTQYAEEAEEVEVEELHIFVGEDYLLVSTNDEATGQKAEAWLRRAFRKPDLDPANPQTLLYFLLDGVVDEYEPILADMDDDLDEIEAQLFSGQRTSQRIYELFNEVVKFQRACRPLGHILERLMRGSQKYGISEELHRHYRDVADHSTRAVEHLDSLRNALQNALTIEATLVGERQNEDMKRISAWAGILILPTIIAGIYGMNFEDMPELAWPLGYAWALALMFGGCFFLWLGFRRRGWL